MKAVVSSRQQPLVQYSLTESACLGALLRRPTPPSQVGNETGLDADTPQTPRTAPQQARDWLGILARYREPSTRRSLLELAVTLVPFFALWALAWMALSVSPWLALALAVLNGAFLVRIFIIQHDCGHGSFLKNRTRRTGWAAPWAS